MSTCARTPSPGPRPRCAAPWPRPRWATTSTARTPRSTGCRRRRPRLLGFEAALWVPSGVMGNEIAIRMLTRPGQEVLADERSHVVQYELAGMAVLSGVMPRIVRSRGRPPHRGDIRAAAAAARVLPVRPGAGRPREHPQPGGGHGGRREADARRHRRRPRGRAARARGRGAALERGRGAGRRAARAGGGGGHGDGHAVQGPVRARGSLLARPPRRDRGGAPRAQAARAAGCARSGSWPRRGWSAMETMVPRLAEDHANARLLAEALAALPGVRVRAGAHEHRGGGRWTAPRRPTSCGAARRRACWPRPWTRARSGLTTHQDVSRADCERRPPCSRPRSAEAPERPTGVEATRCYRAPMRRDLAALANVEHDLLIVGGGICGAAAAWDAAQRGLRGGPGRARRLRLGHVLEQPEDDPRRPAPPPARRRASLRESARERARLAAHRPRPGAPPAVPGPHIRPRRPWPRGPGPRPAPERPAHAGPQRAACPRTARSPTRSWCPRRRSAAASPGSWTGASPAAPSGGTRRS